MNTRKLPKLGVPSDCTKAAIQAVQSAAAHNRTVPKELRVKIDEAVQRTVQTPDAMTGDCRFGDLARAIIETRSFVRPEPVGYKNINEVMAQQADLVEKVARFDPRIVKMCGDGSRAED
jgi:hypothetical protein